MTWAQIPVRRSIKQVKAGHLLYRMQLEPIDQRLVLNKPNSPRLKVQLRDRFFCLSRVKIKGETLDLEKGLLLFTDREYCSRSPFLHASNCPWWQKRWERRWQTFFLNLRTKDICQLKHILQKWQLWGREGCCRCLKWENLWVKNKEYLPFGNKYDNITDRWLGRNINGLTLYSHTT